MGTEKGSPPSPSLPHDLLREVLARCDNETLVRCAASSRLLCRCMLDDPAFLRRRAGGFAPSLLLGAFHSPRGGGGACFAESPAPAVVPRQPIRSFLSGNAGGDLLRSFNKTVACRAGLVVLRRERRASERRGVAVDLCVCNPMTGERCFLPSPAVRATSAAILTGGTANAAAGSSGAFQLLAVDVVMDVVCHRDVHRRKHEFYIRSQLFSSAEPFPATMPGVAWGPVRRAPVNNSGFSAGGKDSPPVVIGRIAHWLGMWSACDGCGVLALDVDEGGAELISSPRELKLTHSRVTPNDVLLASTPDLRLSFVVVEELVISMFVLLSEESWSWERRVVVVREGILAPHRWVWLVCFGERSGTVVISTGGWGRLLLNLETKEVVRMPPDNEELQGQCHLYEMDLASLTRALLKPTDYSFAASSCKLSLKFGQVLATIDTAASAVMPCKIFIGANLLKKVK